MSVRPIVNAFNLCFLIFGMGSVNYDQGKFKMMFYILRCISLCCGLHIAFLTNFRWAKNVDPYIFDITSIVMMFFMEIICMGDIVSRVWRICFDNQLSVVLTKLVAIHEKLIRLKVVRPMKIKKNWLLITGIIVHLMASNILLFKWLMLGCFVYKRTLLAISMAIYLVSSTCECAAFYEYILLILYIRWMAYTINEQIPLRHSTISTYRDMYLEVIDCLNVINTSINGLPVMCTFIAANVGRIFSEIYYHILFTIPEYQNEEVISLAIYLSIRVFDIVLLYGIGEATAQEINRMSLVLHQRSLMERNPRIRRQIKFFIMRGFHKPCRFVLWGIYEINIRKLFSLSNKVVAYVVIQILFQLNRNKKTND